LLEDENMSAINDAIKYAENLKAKLEQEFGPNLLYYPEFLISGEGINSGKDIKLIGVIDLAVIDSSGKVHIIDYKTSVKKYEEFGPTKEISYMY
jgi:RecB family exonuclease